MMEVEIVTFVSSCCASDDSFILDKVLTKYTLDDDATCLIFITLFQCLVMLCACCTIQMTTNTIWHDVIRHCAASHSSDQPGLYYALMQTYEDVYKTGKMKQLCNTSSGYMRTTMDSAGEMDEYFKEVHLIHGHHREPLSDMKEQPIIWSTPTRKEASHDRGGLGLQAKYGPGAEENLKIHAFALHEKNNMGSDCKREVEYCKRVHGCYARYDSDGKFEVGCKDREFTVAQ
mmetsp:Transcript_179/g.465  ORF Transcript_179/g.465 Transcript_179/m.465 type:complete len:231 (-) Transcript_179:197-889(-)